MSNGNHDSKPRPSPGKRTQIRSTERAKEVQAGVPSGGGGNAPLSEAQLLAFISRRIRDSKTDPRLKLQYALKYGEYLRLWGPKASNRKPQEPVGFNIEDDPANLP